MRVAPGWTARTALPNGSAWAGEGGLAARRAARVAAAIAIVVFVLLATNGRPWDAFQRGPFTSDFYDAQARALSRGHVDVPADVAGVEGFVVDGETHLYYGIVPAVARLPISAITSAADGRLVVLSQVVALGVACLAAARLLQRGRAACRVEAPQRWWPWITGGFALAVGVSSPLLWLSSEALVYHEAELWGAALALAGFDRVVAWWATRRGLDLLGAGALAAVALSARPSSGMGPALALGGLAVVLAVQREWRLGAWALGAAAVPFLLYACVNLVRFGVPLSTPFDRQVLNEFSADRRAALADNGGTLFGLKFVPTALVQYLRPDTIEPRALLPWFSWAAPADLIGDVTFDTVDRSASLPVVAPVWLVAWVCGVVAMVRRRIAAAWAVSTGAAAVGVLPMLAIAFIAQRYLADFVPLLVLGAALGVPVIVAWAATTRRRAVGVLAGAVILGVAGLMTNAGLAVLARNLYLLPDVDARRDFVALQYAVHDVLGSGAPDVQRVERLGDVGPDGAIAIVGDCDAVYRSDGATWRLLELRPGGAQRVVVEGSATGPVVLGDGWQIDLVADGTDRRLEYIGPTTVTGDVLPSEAPLRIDVAADAALPTVVVRVDGELVLEAFLRPAAGPLVPAPGWRPIPGEASLCTDLRARLD